jgi:phosphatidylglycerophosphatase A
MASATPSTEGDAGFWATAARLLATAGGAGYSPLVPGTVGSAVGVLSFWGLTGLSSPAQALATVTLFGLGVAAASRTAATLGRKDPGIVVIDEVVGQWASLLFLPLTPATAAVSFLIFRAMDVVKPWPARDFESLPGGLGIMADDLMAGIYANLLLRVVLLVVPLT